MGKNIWISIISIIAVIMIFVVVWTINSNNKDDELIDNESEQNSVEVSETKVTDDCLNEWNDYIESQINDDETTNANSSLNDENTRYLLKDIGGYIYVYYLDDNNEEYLYQETTIPTYYLSAEDIDDLEIGIEVKGVENLNKLLEDFE